LLMFVVLVVIASDPTQVGFTGLGGLVVMIVDVFAFPIVVAETAEPVEVLVVVPAAPPVAGVNLEVLAVPLTKGLGYGGHGSSSSSCTCPVCKASQRTLAAAVASGEDEWSTSSSSSMQRGGRGSRRRGSRKRSRWRVLILSGKGWRIL
jgi:hypothetical protein